MSNSPESEDSSTHTKPTHGEPTYLSDYFAARGFKKPPITWYTIENGSLNNLRQIVANRLFAGSAIRMDYLLAYLCEIADTRLQHRLAKDWISYTIKIGEKDEEISVRNLFEIEKEVKIRLKEETIDDKFGEHDDIWIVFTIFTLWRLNKYRHKPNKFDRTIQKAKQKIPIGGPFQVKLETLSSACKSWGNHPELSKIIAGYDMFLNPLSRYHPFQIVRFGSCISRNRDNDILLSINSTCLSLGIEYYHQFYDWIFIKSLIKETQRVLKQGEDDNFKGYLPYLKDLCQIQISPYSIGVNPGLYFFTNTIGTLFQKSTSSNAQIYKNCYGSDILANACCVFYIFSNVLSFSIHIITGQQELSMTRQELMDYLKMSSIEDIPDDFMTSDNPPRSKDGEKFFMWLKHKQFVIPEVIRRFTLNTAKYSIAARKGSFGSFLKSFDFNESFSWKLESPIE